MTRAVYTENLASFVVVVVEEVWARLCFEVTVHLLRAPSHLPDCCRPSLFIFCKHLAHNRPARSVGVAGFVRKGGTDVFNGLADQISSVTLGELFITNKRGFKVSVDVEQQRACALQRILAPTAGSDLCFLQCHICGVHLPFFFAIAQKQLFLFTLFVVSGGGEFLR